MSLPSNPEAEQALVSRLLWDPKKLALVAGSLRPEHFYSTLPRQVFAAMLALEHDRKVIDLVSVEERVGEKLPPMEFSRLHHGDLEGYVEIIKRDWLRRESIRQLSRVVQQAQDNTDTEHLLTAIGEAVAAINTGVEGGSLVSPDDAVDSYLRTLDDRREGNTRGLTWGIKSLDQRLLPAQPQNLIIVCARPSIGKTAMLEWITEHWARQDRGPILFVSMEMSKDELLDRSISRQTKLSTESLIRGTLTGEQWRLATEAAETIRKVNIWYYDKGGTTTARIRAEAARVKMIAGGLGGIAVDYLGLFGDKEGGDSEVTRVTRISRALKALAKDFNVPVLVAAQLNRNSEMRSDSRPRLSDLRDSGAIEQDADTVIGLNRTTKLSTMMDVGILKSRQGIADTHISIRFDGATMTFGELYTESISSSTPIGTPIGNPVEESYQESEW